MHQADVAIYRQALLHWGAHMVLTVGEHAALREAAPGDPVIEHGLFVEERAELLRVPPLEVKRVLSLLGRLRAVERTTATVA